MNHWWTNLFRSWTKRTPRQLCLGETLALGERQFVSIIEFGETRYLIGRTAASLSLLAQIPRTDTRTVSGVPNRES